MDDQQLRRILLGEQTDFAPIEQKRAARTTKTSTNSLHAREQLERTIRRLAYEVYLQRGAGRGRNFDEWLAAEAEITADSGRQ